MNALSRAPLEGEILGPADVVTVTAAVHPLKPVAEILTLPAGLSLAEIVLQVSEQCKISRLARGADVLIGGHVVDKALWSKVRVKAGAHVLVRARAGKGLSNIFRSLLQVALAIAASFIVGPAGLGVAAAIGGVAGQVVAGALAGAIMLGGGLLLNALFPPSQTTSAENTPSYSISASKNGSSKWGPVPVALGKMRAFPKYAALPYTEFVGDDQYLRLLYVWGYGPLKIEDIKIGDTSIDDYDDVDIETFEGYADDGHQTLYPSEVVQDDFSVEPDYNDPVVRTSAEDASEIVLDFVAASGLGNLSSKNGRFSSLTVEFKIEMSPASAGTWVDKGSVALTGQSNSPIRQSFRYTVDKGEYDVRVTRLTESSDDTNVFDDVTWTAIKSFRTAPPIDFGKPLAITALRIRASKQLNGVVDNLSALVTTVATSWSGTAWELAQETRNPGDLFRLVLQGPANARAQPDSRVDLPSLQAWADVCRARGYTFDMYRDFTASVRDTLKDIAAAGRAVPVFKDGKWSVAWEDDDAPVVQHFTPRNSRDFRWTQTYRALPHGLRCKFVNADKDYVEDEILVFDSGYTKENATLYEQAEFPGVTSPEIVYKHGLYRIADAKERPAVYTLTVDFEHLVAQRADRVAVAHDVISQGISSGRVKAVAGQQITLDEPAVMEAGKLYGLRIRLADGSSVLRQVTTAVGTQPVVTIVGSAPAVGDLYTFGERNHETGIYRILRIRPGDDLSAEIDLVDDGDNVQAGDGATDIPGGSTVPPTGLDPYKPGNLRAEAFLQSTPVGSVYLFRLYWQVATGPEYVSFEAVAYSSHGTIRQVVDGQTRSADFKDLQSDTWTFEVRAILSGNRVTPASDPLVYALDVPWNQVGIETDNLLDGAITELKLADAAVSTAKLQVAAVTSDILDAGSVTNTKIGAAAVDAAKLADAAVTSLKLADAAVTDAKIATGAVLSTKLADNAVTLAKIASGAVDSTKLADAAVTAAKLASQAVTLTAFATGLRPVETVSSLPSTGNVEGRTVTLSTDGKLYRYHSGSWTAAVAAVDLTGQITTTQITDNSITTAKVAANAITATQIAANAVTTSALAANSVTTATLAAGAVTASQIAAGAVTAVAIAAGTITGDKMAVNSITARELYVTDFTNLVPDFQFTNASCWTVDAGWSLYLNASSLWQPADNLWKFTYSGQSTGVFNVTGQTFSVDPGLEYFFSWKYGRSAGTIASFRISVLFYDSSGGALTSYSPFGGNAPTGVTTGTGTFTPPSGAVTARINFYINAGAGIDTDMYVGAPTVRVRNNGNLIVDGAIQANHLSANSVTSAAIAAGTIVASDIAAGAITTSALAANSVTAVALAAGSVTASAIAASTITGDKLAANSITARELIITNFDNLILDAYCAYSASWAYVRSGTTFRASSAIGYNSSGTDALFAAGSTGNLLLSQPIKVDAGSALEVSGVARMGTGGTTGSIRGYLNFLSAAGTQVGFKVLSTWGVSDTGHTLHSDIVTVPSTAITAQFVWDTNGSTPDTAFVVEYTAVRKRYDGNLIVDGAITAAKIGALAVTAGAIAAGAVTTSTIAAGAVTAAQITAGTITSLQLAAGAVTASKIASGTITATQISAGSIDSPSLALNAVTQDYKVALSYPFTTTPPGGYTTTQSLTITNTAGNPVEVGLSGVLTLGPTSGNSVTGAVRILRGATDLGVFLFTQTQSNSTKDFNIMPAMYQDDDAPSGSVTYNFQITWSATGGGSAGAGFSGKMTARVYKR